MTDTPIEPNPIISTTTRLAIMAALAAVEEAEFSTARDNAGVSDSVLSKQATALEASGYLSIRKGAIGRRPRTWLSLTPAGRTALHHHIAALRRIVDPIDTSPRDRQPTPDPSEPGRAEASSALSRENGSDTRHHH